MLKTLGDEHEPWFEIHGPEEEFDAYVPTVAQTPGIPVKTKLKLVALVGFTELRTGGAHDTPSATIMLLVVEADPPVAQERTRVAVFIPFEVGFALTVTVQLLPAGKLFVPTQFPFGVRVKFVVSLITGAVQPAVALVPEFVRVKV